MPLLSSHTSIPLLCTAMFTSLSVSLAAQRTCTDDYFVQQLNTQTAKHNYSSVLTPQQEVVVAGYVLTGGSLKRSGWLTKLSAQGSVLWNRQYNFGFYTSLDFRKVIDAGNGNLLAGGITGNRDTINDAWGFKIPFLVKTDKYGTPLWGKYFDKPLYGNGEINNLLRLADGSFVVLITSMGNNIITKIDDAGNVAWSCNLLNSNRFYLPGNLGNLYRHFDAVMPVSIVQLRNGNLAIAKPTAYIENGNPAFTLPRKGFDMMVLHAGSGDTLWHSSFLYRDSALNLQRPYTDVKNITELPSGDISLIASHAGAAWPDPPYSTSVISLTASATGELKSVYSYTPSVPPIYCTDAVATAAGHRLLLMDNGFSPHLLRIDAAGQLLWARAYNPGPDYGTSTLVNTGSGNYLFASVANGANKQLLLIKTDTAGAAPCVETPVSFAAADITASFVKTNLPQRIDRSKGDFFPALPTTVSTRPYTVTATESCRKTCCTDTKGPVNDVDLCNNAPYTLPDGYTVSQDGTYPIILRSSRGCDSIVYYKVLFSKPPQVSLGGDKCFAGNNTVVLQTSPGYSTYNWMGIPSTGNTYTVTRPGKYWVSVTNGCGTAADTAQVFTECRFSIYMPAAFTPNGDFLNDGFGISPLNKNRLRRFTIFNRYGQKVFETNNPARRWDGTLKGMPQEAGVYVYYLQMETLDGQPLSHKGTVLLIR